MRKIYKRIAPWLGKQLEFPPDVLMELPRITIVGHTHIQIDNHQGLHTFSNNELLLYTADGFMQIQGKEFILTRMMKDEIKLEGYITDIAFISG